MNRQINHKVMRVVVGCIAILLGPAVCLLSGSENELTSISISYWTDSRDVFVGALIAVGFFLSAYNGAGNGRDWEYYLSKATCLFAICVALFPTEGFSTSDAPAKWIASITETIHLQAAYIHTGSAILLFASLIVMMWFFSNRAKDKGKPGRAYFYRCISLLMAGGIIGMLLYGQITSSSSILLFIEFWGLTLFGIGWLIAGTYKTEKLPAKT